MMTVLRSFLIFVFIAAGSACFAHGNLVRGTVTDSLGAQPLVGASVIFNDHASVVTTDRFGNFRLDNLPDGIHRLQIRFVGYRTAFRIVEVAGNQTIEIHVALVPATLELDEVVVGGHRTTAEILTQINRVDIALRPLKSSQDVLRMVPGLVTSQHAGGGKAEQIFLRGFDIDHGTDIALTVDGMPVNMVSHAHGQGYADLHFVTPEIIQQVNFNKGPYYSRVGNFGTAGYADFATKTSLDRSSLKLEGGKFDFYRMVGMLDLLSERADDQHAYLAAEYQYSNGPFEHPQNFNRLNLFGKYSGRVGDDKFVEISLSTFRSAWDASGQIPERAIETGLIGRFGAIDPTEGGSTSRTNANVSLMKIYQDGSTFNNRVYLTHYDFELFSNFTLFLHDPVNGDQIMQRESRNIFGYNGEYTKDLHVGETAVAAAVGIGMRHDDIDDTKLSRVRSRHTFLSSMSRGDVSETNAFAYADFGVPLLPRLLISAGARFDVLSFRYSDRLAANSAQDGRDLAVVTPKVSLLFNATSDIQLYLKSGIGFHSNDARVVVSPDGRRTLPKAIGSDLGIFAKRGRFFMNLAAWQLRMEQEFVYVGDEAAVEPSGETSRYGLDLSLRYQPMNKLFFDFDGNYARGRFINEPEGAHHIPLAPTFTSIAGVTFTPNERFRASLRYRLVSDRPANEDNSVVAKGYFLLDAAASYTGPFYEVSASATNLLNREWNEAQFDTLTRLAGENDGISELTFTPGEPFFFKLGLTVFF